MVARRLKTFMPRSLYGRAALIMLLPVLTILTVVSVVFIQRLYDEVTRQMTQAVVTDLGYVLSRLEEAPNAFETISAELAEPLGFFVTQAGGPDQDRREFIDLTGRIVTETLKAELSSVVQVDLVSQDGRVWLRMDTSIGLLDVQFARGRVSARNPHQFLVLTGFTAILMTIVAFLYLRGQVRPITRLAVAAEAFGKGQNVRYKPAGAIEVRAAGNAFLDMRHRIERQIEQRTTMLSGVSHDLRSPLTRMKLTLSMMDPTDDVNDLGRDVVEMEQMLESFLSFARSDAVEAVEEIDPVSLASSAVERAKRAGVAVTFEAGPSGGALPLRPLSVARALDNLLSNAGRYGTACRLRVSQSDRVVRFVIEDDGPGIPKDQIETAMKPFQRLDAARNQDSGSGVGLGLAIAADVARTHGGSLRLQRSPDMGGLLAEMVLPRARNFDLGASDV